MVALTLQAPVFGAALAFVQTSTINEIANNEGKYADTRKLSMQARPGRQARPGQAKQAIERVCHRRAHHGTVGL